MKSLRVRPVTLSVLLALGAMPVAHADDETGETLETITVTATKRATSLEDTAASITAVSAADIANRGLTDFNSLAESVPGIAMRSSGPGQTEFEMRGLNSSGGNTSMVGFYLDETPLSSPASAQLGKVVIDPNLYDLDHVEVLRGPQGTLYGSSSMGGTVKLVPTAPQLNAFDASGETKLSHTGSGGGLNETVNTMVNLPLGTTAALRIVGSITNDSGWIKRNVIQDGAVAPDITGTRPANFYTAPLAESYPGVNTTDIDSVRATLLWKPTNALTITPALMWQLSRQGGPNTVDVSGNPQYPQIPAVNAHWEVYDQAEPQTDRFSLGSLKIEYQFDTFSLTSATADWARSLIVSQDGSEETDSLLAGVFGTATYDLSGGPSGPTPYGSGVTERDYTQQFTEELRLASTTKGPWQWLAGYYYQKLNSNWSMYSINPSAPALNPAVFGPAGILGGLTNVYVDFMPQTITQNSFFGEVSYEFTSSFKGTLGLRHYNYNLTQNNLEYGLFSVNEDNSTPYLTAASQGASGTDPKLDLSWKISKDALLYFTAAKGFRLGGANQPIPVAAYGVGTLPAAATVQQTNECGVLVKVLLISSAQCAVAPYANELVQAPKTFSSDTVWNYEVGEKWAFLDRRVELNTSAYLERWNDPQISTNLSGFGLTVNGSDARILGLESELRARLPLDLEVSANVGYTDATFNNSNPWTGYPSGMHIPDTPEWTGSLVLLSRGHLGTLRSIGSIEYDYVGTRTNAPYGETIALNDVNELLVHLPAYSLVNLRYGVRGENWGVTAFASNLFNREVLLDTMPQINIQGTAFTRFTVNQPRTIGLDLTYSFGK